MKKILLVEDETSVASYIKKGLSEEGYEVSIALDGSTGLQMALANSFDLLCRSKTYTDHQETKKARKSEEFHAKEIKRVEEEEEVAA